MTKPHLLHLDASARRNGHSRTLSARYAEAWRAAHPDGRYTYRDLVAAPVPFIDEAWTEICDHALANGITDPRRLPEGCGRRRSGPPGRSSSRCWPSWSAPTRC
ncbi:NAD(P)H-dependent oxidoreductase [Dactylosporangium cerinum]